MNPFGILLVIFLLLVQKILKFLFGIEIEEISTIFLYIVGFFAVGLCIGFIFNGSKPMKNKNPKMVEIIEEAVLLFNCKICGKTWHPTSKYYPFFFAGYTVDKKFWQCPNGCKNEDKKTN